MKTNLYVRFSTPDHDGSYNTLISYQYLLHYKNKIKTKGQTQTVPKGVIIEDLNISVCLHRWSFNQIYLLMSPRIDLGLITMLASWLPKAVSYGMPNNTKQGTAGELEIFIEVTNK